VALVHFVVDPRKSLVIVRARSSVHDTDTKFTRLGGTVDVDPEDPGSGAQARISVDMREFDAGDWLKNRKLKGDLEPDRYPEALFTLSLLKDVARKAGERFEARAFGGLAWRGRSTSVEATGGATITPVRVIAECRFDLDVTTLGVKPPKVLMFKVEDVVSVEVRLEASAGG
jgi:polyisoprenoid-binding protein YceI